MMLKTASSFVLGCGRPRGKARLGAPGWAGENGSRFEHHQENIILG
jgi:hypothetical protein